MNRAEGIMPVKNAEEEGHVSISLPREKHITVPGTAVVLHGMWKW